MPIITGGTIKKNYQTIEEFEPSFSRYIGAQVDSAIDQLPFNVLKDNREFKNLQNDIEYAPAGSSFGPTPTKVTPLPRLDRAEIEDRAKAAGVDIDIPAEGLSSKATDFLINRRVRQKEYQETISRSEFGARSLAGFGVQLGVSFLDPINIGLGFVPVVPLARYEAMLAKQLNGWGRAGVRARVGAAEGVAGIAGFEPFNYQMHQTLQDDYSAMDSLINIGFGGIFGGGLHVGAGAMRDAYLGEWWKPNIPPGAPPEITGGVYGSPTKIKIGDVYEPAKWAVMDAEDITATMSKADNQFRDRTRLASDSQVRDVANNIDFNLLAESPIMDLGAPTLSRDGLVVGGNGRVAAINLAHEIGTGGRYLNELRAALVRFGIDPEAIAGMKRPALVRVLDNEVDIKRAAIASNEGGSMRMSSLEQAKVDAERMANFKMFEIGEDGGINATANKLLIKSWINEQPVNQRSALIDADGVLSVEGQTRLKNAIIYKAYGDSPTLTRLVESTDPGSKNIASALVRSAGAVADAQEAIKTGDLNNIDISKDIAQAVEKLDQLRSEKTTVDQFMAQGDMIGSGLTAEAINIMRFMSDNIRSPLAISDFINNFYRALNDLGNPKQADIFGSPLPSKSQLMKLAPEAEEKIVNPIDKNASPAEKIKQLEKLTKENQPIVKNLMEEIDRRFGTESKDSVKETDKILEKSVRPSILKEKPWHGVEHIRDSYRFKTVLKSIDTLPDITKLLASKGITVVKADFDKMLKPKEFGWRIAVFDLKMKNGQLVEYYLPLREMEAAKKNGGHQIFEEVRNLDLRIPALAEKYFLKAKESSQFYQKAWEKYLARTNQTEREVRASLINASAALGDNMVYPSSKSPPLDSGAGDSQVPSKLRTAENSPANTNATLDPLSDTNAKLAIDDLPPFNKSIADKGDLINSAIQKSGDEGITARHIVEIATPHEREVALRASVGQLMAGKSVEVTPIFTGKRENAEWMRKFKGSRIVDENGDPLTVYHGSDNVFDQFDYSRIGTNGRAEGGGFYFTSDKSIAQGYGSNVKEVNLAIKNPMDYDQKGFGKLQLRKILTQIAEMESKKTGEDIQSGFLSNFGDTNYEGVAAVIQDAARLISEDPKAIDQMGGLIGAGVDIEIINRAVKNVTGFDGIVSKGFSNQGGPDLYVAFFPDQIMDPKGRAGEAPPEVSHETIKERLDSTEAIRVADKEASEIADQRLLEAPKSESLQDAEAELAKVMTEVKEQLKIVENIDLSNPEMKSLADIPKESNIIYRIGWAEDPEHIGKWAGDASRVAEHINAAEDGYKPLGDTIYAYAVPKDVPLNWEKQTLGNALKIPKEAVLVRSAPYDYESKTGNIYKRSERGIFDLRGRDIEAELGNPHIVKNASQIAELEAYDKAIEDADRLAKAAKAAAICDLRS